MADQIMYMVTEPHHNAEGGLDYEPGQMFDSPRGFPSNLRYRAVVHDPAQTPGWHPHTYPEATPNMAVPVSDHGAGEQQRRDLLAQLPAAPGGERGELAGLEPGDRPTSDPVGGESRGKTGPEGAQTGHRDVDRGGAASGAGAGSPADKGERRFKGKQRAAVENTEIVGGGEAEVAAQRGDTAAQRVLDDGKQDQPAAAPERTERPVQAGDDRGGAAGQPPAGQPPAGQQ